MTVEALRRRRPETLAELLDAYGRELQAVAYLILRDRADAEDVVDRDAADRVRARRLHPRGTGAARLAAAGRHEPGPRPDAAGPPASSAWTRCRTAPARRPGVDSSTRIALLDGIADLPLQMRAAVVLRYYADLSVDEVAAALGKSPNTIKAQLQTALDRLRIHLADPLGTSLEEASHA